MSCNPFDYRSKASHSDEHEDQGNFVKGLFESQRTECDSQHPCGPEDWEKAWRKKADWNAYREEMGFRSKRD